MPIYSANRLISSGVSRVAIYTSAGVSVSMDLTLAMVKEDYGQALAGEVAKRLVVFVYRPGE